MSRQIYPTLLVTSLVLATVVCLHPSIVEEFLALVGVGPLDGGRHQARAQEPQYTPIPTVPSTRYGTVPQPPVEPTQGVRPASWPAPANVEVSGGAAIPDTNEPPSYPPGSYGYTPSTPPPVNSYPQAQTGGVTAPNYPQAAPGTPSPQQTVAGPVSGPVAGGGPVPQVHAPATPHWQRGLATEGNPYRNWEPPAGTADQRYSSWGRNSSDAPAPYQQWNPPNEQVPAASAIPPAPRYGDNASTPSDAPAPYQQWNPPNEDVPAASTIPPVPRYGDNASMPQGDYRSPGTSARPVLPPPPTESLPPELPPPPTESLPTESLTTEASTWPRRPTPSAAPVRPSTPAPPAEPFEGAEILARVGPEVILCSEVIAPVNEVINKNRDKIPEGRIPEFKRKFLKQHLQSVIDTKLIYLDATRQIPEEALPGIRNQLTDLFYAKQLPEMKKSSGAKNRDELETYLEGLGSSLARERDAFIEKALAQQWMFQQTDVEQKVTHEQMLTYYHDHIEEFSYPSKARWEQLTVRIADFPSRREAHAAVARLGNLLMDGAPFDQLARVHSKGPTARKGGLRDWTSQGSLVSKKLDNALFGLPIGQLSPILEDDGELHIIRVLERTEAGREAFVDAQVAIREKVQQKRRSKVIEEYLGKLRRETRVTTVFDEDPPEANLAQPPQPTTPYRY